MSVPPRDWQSHPPYLSAEYKSTGLRGPTQPLVKLDAGLMATTGPAYDARVVEELDNDLTRNARVNGDHLFDRPL